MSPPVFLLGSFSILTVWVIRSLGLPPDLWTFGVIPVLLVYVLSDQRKLWGAVVQARGSRGRILSPAIVVVVAILLARFGSILLWKVCIFLVSLLCTVGAYDFEKQMYMTDTYGALAKVLVWKVIVIFTGEAMWMSYKGEWANCCPYTRKLVRKEIDQYYILQLQPEEQDGIIPENYDMTFSIGSCNLHCVYTAAPEDHVGGCGDTTPASATVVSRPVESPPSAMPSTGPNEKARADAESASSRTSSMEGESSSSKADLGLLVKDHYTLVSSHVNKVEVSLEYQNTTLESYTFYNSTSEAVAELKRVLVVLKEDGNIIFSTLNRDIGASRPRAHARCYKFEELFDLILAQGYKLHAVELREKYTCTISGHWTLQLQPVLLVGVMIGINYYQLTKPPRLGATVSLLTLYALVNIFFVLGTYVCQEKCKLRKLVHCIISTVTPSKLDDCYRWFYVHVPALTFCNESYSYPYTSSQREVCLLENGGSIGRLPVIGTENPRHFLLEDLRDGNRIFDLRNLQLELCVTSVDDEVQVNTNDKVEVAVQMRRTYGDLACCYHEIFLTEKNRAADLIAMMNWVVEHSCVGVGKDWSKSSLMLAYRYDELFRKVLVDGLRPMILKFVSPIDITVE